MIICSLLFALFGLFEDPVLVEDGKAAAEIVITEKPTLNDEFCAGELQYWVREITGAKLPIGRGEGVASTKIYLGRALAEKRGKFADDFAFFGETDGYAVRRDGKDLYLFGGKPSSTLWAIYELLERTTGVIWPSMAKGCDRVFDRTDKIAVKEDFREKPFWSERHWSINNGYYYNHPPTETFCLRNKCVAGGSSARLKAAGLSSDSYECHNLHGYLPWEKYKDTHPEYFCIIDGVRTPPGWTANLCFSSMEGADEFAKNYIRDNIEGDIERTVSGIGIEDANNTCQCANCLKPIKLPDGTILERKGHEKVFDSTRYYLWLNRVCERIAEKYPNHQINTIGYMFTTEPPAVPLAKNLTINFCAIGKDTRRTYGEKGTEDVTRIFEGWRKLSKKIAVYEYWGCGAAYPRPVEYVIQKDLKYYGNTQCFRNGTEWIHKNGAEYVSALDFWVANKLLWDSTRDIEELRREFCRRTFREGAEEMYAFYSVVRDAWFKDTSRSTWSDSPVNATAFLLKSEGERATKAIAGIRTAERKITNPCAKNLVAKIAEYMEKYVAEVKKLAKVKGDFAIPYVANAADVTSFEGPSWAKAADFPSAEFLDSTSLTNATAELYSAKALSDGKTLWFKLHVDATPSPRQNKTNLDLREHWEIFLDGHVPGVAFHRVAVDPAGVVSSFVECARTKGALACKAQVREVGSSGWEAIVGVPLEALKLKEDGKMRLTFVHVPDGAKPTFGWYGAFPCNYRHLRSAKIERGAK